MIGSVAAIILSFLLATMFAAAFHLVFGGSPGRILLYIVMSCLGFALGHFIGQAAQIGVFRLGALHLLPATIGSLVALFISRWLWADLQDAQEP